MSVRRQVENRRYFTDEERYFIKSKSNNLCSHCGKKLDTDFTVEHVVPISKGGTNDLSNIVALCKSCNHSKDDTIVHPKDYYKFLLPDFLDELIENQVTYYKKYNWLTPKCVLPEDVRELKVGIIPHVNRRSVSKKKSKAFELPMVASTITLKKAFYCDLDNIYEFYLRHTMFDKATLKDMLTNDFINGVIYYLVDRCNEIKAVIPVRFEPYHDDYTCNEEVGKETGVVLHFITPLISKSDINYTFALSKAYSYILSNVTKLLGKPIYYSGAIHLYTSAMSDFFVTLVSLSESIYGYSYFNEQGQSGVRFTGIWSTSDMSFLDNCLTFNECKNIHSYSTILDKTDSNMAFTRDGITYYTVRKGEFVASEYKTSMREFAIDMAKQFGYIDDEDEQKSEEQRYVIVDLPIDSIQLPEGCTLNVSIPSFVKQQVKTNTLKPIKVDALSIISKQDIPILAYLKQLKRKTVTCHINRKYIQQDSLFAEEELPCAEEDYDFIKSLYLMECSGDSEYASYKIILKQCCTCHICGKRFSNKNLPYTTLKKPKRLGGTMDYDNIFAACNRCKNLVGIMSYTEDLKKLILEEISYEDSMKGV